MARRGDKLREHILFRAKDVFLEMGFERASMDMVASRAETSKRSLYAHFESKEKLFLAIIELVRSLFLASLRMPADYSPVPAEAVVLYCRRYAEVLLYDGSIRMCRVSLAEADRFPEGARLHFDVMFTEVHTRLAGYLANEFSLSEEVSDDAAQRLLGQVLHPLLPRALFGVDRLTGRLADEVSTDEADLAPIRKAVDEMIASFATERGVG